MISRKKSYFEICLFICIFYFTYFFITFQTLQRKHEGVERDLAALEDKVSLLAQEAEKLCSTHPEHADQIMVIFSFHEFFKRNNNIF